MMPQFVKTLPGYRQLHAWLYKHMLASNPWFRSAPPGHFMSPLPDLTTLSLKRALLFDRSAKEVLGIDINEKQQLMLMERLSTFYSELPFRDHPCDGMRYYFKNGFFEYGDGIILYSMIRQFKPTRIIEVGSGFSSALMLDVNDRFFGKSILLKFIEPYPDRLFSLLDESDKRGCEIIQSQVQELPVEHFTTLKENDILFIDSSHVVKIGSDLSYIFNVILPSLAQGVIIHFHDVFWPFEYPEEWILKHVWAWNEDYFLRAFLQFNSTFKIIFFNSYIERFHADKIGSLMPLFRTNGLGVLHQAAYRPFSSLWIMKTA
jgi:predicted O-methyltransferase YrrM